VIGAGGEIFIDGVSSGHMALRYGEFYGDGVFTVPAGVTSIYITACGGGGGGGSEYAAHPWGSPYNGHGGKGGEFVINQHVTVFPGENIRIIIGKGGAGGDPVTLSGVNSNLYDTIPYSNPGEPGEATILGPFTSLQGDYITLQGGAGSIPNPQSVPVQGTSNPADGQPFYIRNNTFGGGGGEHSLGGGGGGGAQYSSEIEKMTYTGGSGGISDYFAWGGAGGGADVNPVNNSQGTFKGISNVGNGQDGQGPTGGRGGIPLRPTVYDLGGGGGGGAMGGGGGGGGRGFAIHQGSGGGGGGHGYVLITWANPDTTD
jgi:hypothetical protein